MFCTDQTKRSVAVVAAVIGGLFAGLSGVRAQEGPVIAIPGNPEVPVIINGRDASYRVVVGDWGLARPGAVPVVVYGPPAYADPDGRGYYPSTGRRPRSGRQEIENPARVLPPPAPSYHRSWSTSSNPDPVTNPSPSSSSDSARSDDERSDAARHRRHHRTARQAPDGHSSEAPQEDATGTKPPVSSFPAKRKHV
jgi:hypothetical protein